MISSNSINNLLSNLKYKIQNLNWVHSVINTFGYSTFKKSDESPRKHSKF